MISWEVFFADRAREAAGNGGQVLLNPTNGVTPEGGVVQRTGVSERAVLRARVELRSGRTWAVTVGDWLALAVAIAAVARGWVLDRRDR